MLKLLAVVLVAFALANAASRDRNKKPHKLVCYLGTWANYRTGEGKFLIEDIDPFLCTHIVYGFAKLNGNSIAAYDPYLDLKDNWGLGAYERFNNLKKINPELTTILAIGGWNEGSAKYSAMASTQAGRSAFAKSCVDFLLKYDFDGLDMDWEYPANRGGKPEDKQTFILLLKELKEQFKPHGFMLTAAVAAGKSTIDTAYDIKGMGEQLDIVNLMAYDFHGSWEKVTGHHAPLHARDEESEAEKALNVVSSVEYWLKGGTPPEKLVLGIGLYGRSFTLENAANNGIGAPAPAKGAAGPITKEGGMLGYNEICKFLKAGWTEKWAPGIDSPYAHHGKQWVGYDNERSISLKMDYLKQNGLGGGMVWSLETDDFKGICGGKKYPLLSLMYEQLMNGKPSRQTPAPPKSTQGTEKPPVVTENQGGLDGVEVPDDGTYIQCNEDGYMAHPTDCQKYVKCANYRYKIYTCGDGRAFSKTKKTCVPKSEAGC